MARLALIIGVSGEVDFNLVEALAVIEGLLSLGRALKGLGDVTGSEVSIVVLADIQLELGTGLLCSCGSSGIGIVFVVGKIGFILGSVGLGSRSSLALTLAPLAGGLLCGRGLGSGLSALA